MTGVEMRAGAHDGPPERRSRDALVGAALGATTVTAGAVFMLWTRGTPRVRALFLAVSIAAFGAIFICRSWRRSLSMRVVWVLCAAILLVAVVARPNGTDLWYYQLYGRIVVHYHQSPYKHPPAEHSNDPIVKRTDYYWLGVRAEYGPLLIGMASAVAAVTGTSDLPARLAWQGGAMLAVFLALLLVGRRTNSAAAVALVGLNPVVWFSGVNAGHADTFIGLALLVGVVLARERRDVLAAVALTLAALVKGPVGIALVAFLAWLWLHDGVRTALRPAAAAAATALVALAASGGRAALQPAFDARARTNSVTPWNVVRSHGLDPFRGTVSNPGALPHVIPTVAVVAAVVLAVGWVVSRLGDEEPSFAVAGAVVAWLALALYTSPWSGIWAIPVLALHHRALLTRLAVAWFCLLTFQTNWGMVSVIYLFHADPNASTYAHVNAVLIAASMTGAIVLAVALAVEATARLRGARWPGRHAYAS